MPNRPESRLRDGDDNVDRPFDVGPANGDSAADPVAAAVAEARERGYREGRQNAEKELGRELERARREIAASLQRLAQLEESLGRRHEALLLGVTIEAASRLLRQRVESGDPVAARALAEALEAIPRQGAIKARLHPDDEPFVRELVRSEIEAGRIELVADESVSRGGTLVESDAGTIDATLETAEAAVRSALVGDGSQS